MNVASFCACLMERGNLMSGYINNITLVVSSCDKYEDAWYPYFELVKKYWSGHPEKICLISETKKYASDGLNIENFNYGEDITWSERLYRTLENIDTKYIIFSLEDFFLLDYVKEERIEECYSWMEENPNIAVCRLYSSDAKCLKLTDMYKDFYVADSNMGYRLDTQVALWNREILMSFIDLSENPWQFEEKGTERIKNTNKIFLWHYSDDLVRNDDKIFCYKLFQQGYGISWGHWLWKNKKWFKANNISKVRYYRLGSLSESAVNRRNKHLYNKNQTKIEKFVRPFWRMFIRLRKVKSNIFVFGLKKGLFLSWKNR